MQLMVRPWACRTASGSPIRTHWTKDVPQSSRKRCVSIVRAGWKFRVGDSQGLCSGQTASGKPRVFRTVGGRESGRDGVHPCEFHEWPRLGAAERDSPEDGDGRVEICRLAVGSFFRPIAPRRPRIAALLRPQAVFLHFPVERGLPHAEFSCRFSYVAAADFQSMQDRLLFHLVQPEVSAETVPGFKVA